MKYFYSIVIDGYAYHEVTEHRYKNEIDFYYHILPENFEDEEMLGSYLNPWDYLDAVDCYPTGDSYVAVDENNHILDDLESCETTYINDIRSVYFLNDDEPEEDNTDPEYELYLELKKKYEK